MASNVENSRYKSLLEIANPMTQSSVHRPEISYSSDSLSILSNLKYNKKITDKETIQLLDKINKMAWERNDFRYTNTNTSQSRTNFVSFNETRKKNLLYSFVGIHI